MIVVLPVPLRLPSPPKSKLLPNTSVKPLSVKRTDCVTLPTLIKFFTVILLSVIIGNYKCLLGSFCLSFRCLQRLNYCTRFGLHFQPQYRLQLSNPVHALPFC